MAEYVLYATMTISTASTVEADSLEEAIEKRYEEGWPGVMFLDHTYPDIGDWYIDEEAAEEDYPNG